MKKFSWFKIQN